MKAELTKNGEKKDFFQLMSNTPFWKNYGKCNKSKRY